MWRIRGGISAAACPGSRLRMAARSQPPPSGWPGGGGGTSTRRRQARSRISAGDPAGVRLEEAAADRRAVVGVIPVSQSLMADHIRAFGQHLPDERGRLLRAEVHL